MPGQSFHFYNADLVTSTPAPMIYEMRSQVATEVAYHMAIVNLTSAASYSEIDELRAEFEDFADEWHDETGHLSSPEQIAMHGAYQHIIGMGDAAVPLILQDLRVRGGFWFWALGAITNASPAPAAAAGDMFAIRDAWINWGRQKGYLVI